MQHIDFHIGLEFWCSGKRWRCTDIGTRTIAAICLEPPSIQTVKELSAPQAVENSSLQGMMAESWYAGPPYAVAEILFDENDIPACEVFYN